MKEFEKISRNILPVIGLFLFIAALWILHKELQDYHIHDILSQLQLISLRCIVLASFLTLLDYFILTLYDFLALRSIDHPLDYLNICSASFISFAFSHNAGLTVVAGGSVRYRIYTSLGLSPAEVARIIAFTTGTFWLGYSIVGGIAFLLDPLVLPGQISIPFGSLHFLGILLLMPGVLYIGYSLARHNSMKVNGIKVRFYSSSIVLPQALIASSDWIVASSVLFVLIRSVSDISFFYFLGIFLLAQLSGVMSQVPGGLGVFETVVVLLMPPSIDRHALMGSLLAYRGIYYLVPFFVAIACLGAREAGLNRKLFMVGGKKITSVLLPLIPYLFSMGTFVTGAILLASGSLPVTPGYLEFLEKYIPLTLVELSHFLGALTGVALLFLSQGLRRKIDTAWFLSCVLLASGIIFSILRGSHYVEVAILLVMIIPLIPAKKHFTRKGMLLGDVMSPHWLVSVFLVLIATTWLGLFSYRHVNYSTQLWWQFTLESNAPRFLRGQAGVLIFVIIIALKQLFGHAKARDFIEEVDSSRVEKIVSLSPRSDAFLALLPDKQFYFSSSGNAMIMYGIRGKSWISMGDPLGVEEEWADLLWDFRERADKYGGNPLFYQISPSQIVNYVDMGLTLVKLGEVGKVHLGDFTLEGSDHKKFRWTLRKAEKEGLSFRVLMPAETENIMDRIEEISNLWLADKHTREKGFSLGFFNREYLANFPIGVVEWNSSIVAFANLWPSYGKEEISPDLMRYTSDIPMEVMDYLFLNIMIWAKEQGFRYFDLGMAPLSGLEGHKMAPLWQKFGNFLFRHGEYFYNFQGLRQYKDKFGPDWEPRYLAFPGRLSLPGALTDVSTLIAGGIKGLLLK